MALRGSNATAGERNPADQLHSISGLFCTIQPQGRFFYQSCTPPLLVKFCNDFAHFATSRRCLWQIYKEIHGFCAFEVLRAHFGYAPGMRRHAPVRSQNGPMAGGTAARSRTCKLYENPWISIRKHCTAKENKQITGQPTDIILKRGMRRGMRRIYIYIYIYIYI